MGSSPTGHPVTGSWARLRRQLICVPADARRPPRAREPGGTWRCHRAGSHSPPCLRRTGHGPVPHRLPCSDAGQGFPPRPTTAHRGSQTAHSTEPAPLLGPRHPCHSHLLPSVPVTPCGTEGPRAATLGSSGSALLVSHKLPDPVSLAWTLPESQGMSLIAVQGLGSLGGRPWLTPQSPMAAPGQTEPSGPVSMDGNQ